MTFKTHFAAALIKAAGSRKWRVSHFTCSNGLDSALWLTTIPTHAYMLARWWAAPKCEAASKWDSSLFFFLSGPLRPLPQAKVHKHFFWGQALQKHKSVRRTWGCLFSYQSRVIDCKPSGSDSSVPGRCGRQDDRCHKCPVMQQDHKQFLSLSFSPSLSLLSSHSEPMSLRLCPGPLLLERLPLTLPPPAPWLSPRVHRPTHVNTKPKQPARLRHLSCINSDLFMSDRSVGGDRPDRCIPASAVPSRTLCKCAGTRCVIQNPLGGLK